MSFARVGLQGAAIAASVTERCRCVPSSVGAGERESAAGRGATPAATATGADTVRARRNDPGCGW